VTVRPSRRHNPCDGTACPTTSGNNRCDGCDGFPRGRLTRPVPPAKGPYLTEQPRPSHGTTGQTTAPPKHRSARHASTVPPHPTQPPAEHAEDQPSTATGVPAPRRASRATRRESYEQQQARLDAEAVARWARKITGMAPMTQDQISAVADIFRRIDARRAHEQT
jgi:hypothetical protein